MQAPPLPADETARLEALRKYEILDTAPEAEFDDLTLLASFICGTPRALVSFVDRDRQWFKSRRGVSIEQTPRDIAFCAYAILKRDVMVISDANNDERFADNPMVTGEPRIRFYAGAPLITPEGQALGTLCVLDDVPRQLDPEQIEALRALARQTVAQMELRRRLMEEREVAGATVAEKESHLRLIAGQIPAVIWSTDREMKLTYSAGKALGAMGQRPDQFVGVSLFDYFQTKDPEFYPLVAHRRALLGESVTYEIEWSGRTFASHVAPLRNSDRTIKGVIGIALDITRQKRTENELKKAVTMLHATLDSTDDAILVVNERGKIADFNHGLVELFGIPERVAAARDPEELMAVLLERVKEPGRFAKLLMGLHSKSDEARSDLLELVDGRRLHRSYRPQSIAGRPAGTVWSFHERAER
jgi:PAS domain S-box-containing protein